MFPMFTDSCDKEFLKFMGKMVSYRNSGPLVLAAKRDGNKNPIVRIFLGNKCMCEALSNHFNKRLMVKQWSGPDVPAVQEQFLITFPSGSPYKSTGNGEIYWTGQPGDWYRFEGPTPEGNCRVFMQL